MGLDIYFYKTKTSREVSELTNEDINELYKERIDRKMTAEAKAARQEAISVATSERTDKVEAILAIVRPYIKYEFMVQLISQAETTEELCHHIDDVFESSVSWNDMYYRKVNFLYGYFSERLTDEQCLVTKEDIEDIISRCENVLDDHSKAEELLPTCSGFFFGSTEYDEYYFSDVAQCLAACQDFLSDWTDDTAAWVYFSW
jgi:hypothetical protein